VTQGLTEENFYLVDKYGGQGQADSQSESGQRSCPQGEDRHQPIRINRTAETGIFRASKINSLLIILKQRLFGTAGDSCVDSAG
jgi:hypothetical protein